MRMLLLLFVLLSSSAALGQSNEHPKIFSGSAISVEQASSLGFQLTTWPKLSRGDRLLFEFGAKRLLVEVVECARAFDDGQIDESFSLNWMVIRPDAVATGSKKLVHQITTQKAGNHVFYPTPKSDTLDELTFSWHVESPAECVVLDIPPGIYYTLIRRETAAGASSPR